MEQEMKKWYIFTEKIFSKILFFLSFNWCSYMIFIFTFKFLHSTVFSLLCSRVKSKDEEDVSVSSDSLGEQLFELVDVYSTGHSQKITGKKQNGLHVKLKRKVRRHFRIILKISCPSSGMLLEQHKDAVLKLLSDPKLLEEQVTLALKTLKEWVNHQSVLSCPFSCTT